MLFLDPQSRFFGSFIARIRAFRLPIDLEAKAPVVRPLALRDRLRDSFLRGGRHAYGLVRLARRRCHLMISLRSVRVKILRLATSDVVRRAHTLLAWRLPGRSFRMDQLLAFLSVRLVVLTAGRVGA